MGIAPTITGLQSVALSVLATGPGYVSVGANLAASLTASHHARCSLVLRFLTNFPIVFLTGLTDGLRSRNLSRHKRALYHLSYSQHKSLELTNSTSALDVPAILAFVLVVVHRIVIRYDVLVVATITEPEVDERPVKEFLQHVASFV